MNRKSEKEKIFKIAMRHASCELAAEAERNTEEVEFSDSHKERMEKIFEEASKKERILKLSKWSKTAACIVGAFIVSGVAVFGGVTAWNRITPEYHFDPKKPGTTIKFSDGESTSYNDEFLYLEYVPPRFVCTVKKSDENIEFVRFEGENGKWFELCFYITGEPEINTDEDVNQYIGNNGKYAICVTGNTEKEELEKIAQNADVFR